MNQTRQLPKEPISIGGDGSQAKLADSRSGGGVDVGRDKETRHAIAANWVL